MSQAPRPFALAWIAPVLLLAGCMTPHAKVHVSQAVLDARAHRDAPPAPACPPQPLSAVSPLLAGFPFDESALGPEVGDELAGPTRWIACHPATPVVIKPDADGHGTPAEQDTLSRGRAQTVLAYLTAHGVDAGRVRTLTRGQAEPAGEHFLIRAEGRRW